MHAIHDLLLRFVPGFLLRKEYSFAFIVHPRDFSDIFRKYPSLKSLNSSLLEHFSKYFWPITVSKVTGLQSKDTGGPITGYIISIAMTAEQMLSHRTLAQKRLRQAILLAEKKGAAMIGLGALTSSITKGGLDLLDHTSVGITTGHAYTGYNVTRNILQLTQDFQESRENSTIAIVGAAGSVGSISAQILAQKGYRNFILVDLERKHALIHDLVPQLKKLNPQSSIVVTHKISEIRSADYVICATNAPEAVIHADDLKSGSIVINDAQPSDVSDDVYARDDVVVIEAGVVHTPGISSNFNLGLNDKFDNFCCMAEVLILAARKHDSHYVIHRPTLDHVEEIGQEGQDLGFVIAQFQNKDGPVSDATLERIRHLRLERVHVSQA